MVEPVCGGAFLLFAERHLVPITSQYAINKYAKTHVIHCTYSCIISTSSFALNGALWPLFHFSFLQYFASFVFVQVCNHLRFSAWCFCCSGGKTDVQCP